MSTFITKILGDDIIEVDGEPVPFRVGDLIVRGAIEAKVEAVYPQTRSLVAYYTDGSGDGGNFKWEEVEAA